MAWGAQPSFSVRGELSYRRCDVEYETGKQGVWNISAQPDKRSNYNVHKVSRDGVHGYALKMYSTDIITWWETGDIEYENYDSGITRDVMNEFGPLRIWKEGSTKHKYHHDYRWGRPYNYYTRQDIVSYPFCQAYGHMRLPANGIIKGMYDEYSRIDPKQKPQRREMLKSFRMHALPRVLLGEFSNRFAVHGAVQQMQWGRRRGPKTTGWWAHVPSSYIHRKLFESFRVNADHEIIEAILSESTRWEFAGMAQTEAEAQRKALDHIGRNALEDSKWYEKVRVEHGPVKWKQYAK